MKLYTYVVAFAVGSPQVWGADAPRVTYHVETVAGSSLIGDGGPALSAQFSNIQGIAVDRLGNLYLSDTSNHRVRKVSGGIVTTIAGTGVAGYSGDGGKALNAQLDFPYGLALDSAGNLYVADFGNERVRKIAPDGTITTIAGTGQRASSPDDSGGPLGTSLLSPRNVAVDPAGNLYIAEFDGHRVRKLGTDGKILTVAGTGEAGFLGDGGPATLAQLHSPAGLAFKGGYLLIADSVNNVIREIYEDGRIGTVLGRPPGVTTPLPLLPLQSQVLLYTPIALAVDAAGTIYVEDASTTVSAWTTTLRWTRYAGSGDAPGFSGDGGPATSAPLSSVYDLAANGFGDLWIADGVRVRKVDSTGTIRTVAGDGYVAAVGDGGPATAANLYKPAGLTLDGAGNLFIADTGTSVSNIGFGTQRVRQVAPDGTIRTLAGTGVAGQGAVGGEAATTALFGPADVTMDVSGNVVIADTQNHRIVKVNAAHQLLAVVGTGTRGESPDGVSPLAAPLNAPRGVRSDRGGNLYIADTSNHRVLQLPPDTGAVLKTAAGNGSWGYAGDGGDARMAQLNAPSGSATDSAGTLYIADTGNHAIRKVTAGKISTVAGTGIAGSAVDEGTAASAQLASPSGVAVDDAGDIFIADTGNNQIRMVTPDGLIHVIAGTGFAGFAGDGGPATAAQLNGPQGLFLDGAGDLYFADTNNNRIRRLVPDAPAPAPVVMPVSTVTVVNVLSLLAGSVAPGEVVSVFGLGLGPDLGVTGTLDASGMLPGILAGVEVQFNGSDAPIFYAVSGQINAQVPYVVAGSDASTVAVIYQGKVVGTATVGVAPSAPGLLTVATNQDGTVNAQAAPAARGGWMTFFATGEGLTDSGDVAGAPAHAPYPHPLLAISLTIAGLDAEILYAGSAPDLIGVMQINARVPGGFVPPGQAAVALTVGTVTAPAVTVWLK